MNGMKLLRLASQSIMKHKMRSSLTMLGIIIGVAAVIILVAIGEGAQKQIEDQITGLGSNLIIVFPGTSQMGGVSRGAGSFNRITLDDYDDIKRYHTLLDGVSPIVRTGTQIVGPNGNWSTFVLGVSEDYARIRDWKVENGDFFTETDVRSKSKVCIIGSTIANEIFPGEDPVGQQVRLRNVPFKIIGVLESKGQSVNGDDQDDIILAPYTTVYYRLSGWRFIQQVIASAISKDQMNAAMDEIREIMRTSHKIDEGDEDDFTLRTQDELAEAMNESTRVMTLLLAAVASVSLLVGGIGIMNIMLVSVTERTREIGIRMALGARPVDILIQFLVEAMVLSLIGGMIGIGVGIGVAEVLSNSFGWTVTYSVPFILLSVGFSAVIGIFFGFYPARSAAALNPIDALRYE